MTELTLDHLITARDAIKAYKPTERYVYIIPRWFYDQQDLETRQMIDRSETIHVSDFISECYEIDTEYQAAAE